MEKVYIATGKTIDLAVASALEELKLDRDSVSVEVLDNAKRGLFGIGAQPARIKVTYEVPDEPEVSASALSSASRKPKKSSLPVKQGPAPVQGGAVLKPKKPTPVTPAAPISPAAPTAAAPALNSSAPRSEQTRPVRQQKPPKQQTEHCPAPAREAEAAPKPPKEYAPAAPGSTEEQIEVFLKGLLEHMGSDAVPHAWMTDSEKETYSVDLVGEHLGMLIGRRGDTLDAIQHLTNYSINRGSSRHVRVNVDAEDYRRKREESLQRLALKVAGKVVKFRRNITLEPMNAYERHVIHACLQDKPGVSTYSIGTEPNRRVVVAYGAGRAPKQQ